MSRNRKMKAVLKPSAQFGAELVTVDIPKPKSNEVLIKVKATSICGTDVHIYEWNQWAMGRIKVPQILGHEFAGDVVEVGDGVSRIKVGDYVSAETHIPCNNCIQCLTGQQHICSNLKILGVDCDGCFAEYVVVPETVVWKNDPGVPPEYACVQEPLGNAIYAVTAVDVSGKTVVILGEGPTGLFAVGVARLCGAAQIFVVGKHDFRLGLARKMGADVIIHAVNDDVVNIIMEATGGVGVDVVFEMAGTQLALEHGFKVLRKGGQFIAFGIFSGPVSLDINNDVVFKGATIYGINGREMYRTWFKTANWLKYNKLDVSPVITHKLSLDEYKEGFRLMMERPKISGKVVLFP